MANFGPEMNKRKIQIVIIFSVLALIGSIAIQYYWISMLYDQNKFLFDQRVEKALKFAVNSVEKQEHLFHIQNHRTLSTNIRRMDVDGKVEEWVQIEHDNTNKYREVFIKGVFDSLNTGVIIINNEDEIEDLEHQIEFINMENSWTFDRGAENIEATVHIKLENDSVIQHFEATADSLIQVLEYKTKVLKEEKNSIETTIDQLVWEMDEWSKPFGDSVPSQLISELLLKSLVEFNLPNKFEFAVLDSLDEDIILFETNEFKEDLKEETYFSNLYPYELIPRQRSIALQVSHSQLFASLTLPIALSIAFTLMLTIGLLLIIKNLLHHRKVSEVQSDFINNMTHEFKTPIATISLASDSILNPIILNNQEKVSYFTGMIKKENKRMNRLVEKILQMARLENKELKLEIQKVKIHDILTAIIENSQVKLKDQGNISTCLNADQDDINADQVHLTNVFYNLLDNAIKYSDNPVDINVSTSSTKSHVFINIKDHGKGMNKKEIQHIFDRFYRIEAGNVHNVKGYGLGLTYVKAIIEKHGGSITVKSELNVGSSFEIKLPIHH